MSMSGIQIPEDVVKKYEDKRYQKKPGGLILKINDEQVEIEHELDENFEDLVNKLPDAEPRYVLYDVPVKNRAKLDDVKTCFIFWMPMESPVRLRMRYASTKANIPKKFRGIALQIQPEEKDEVTLDKVIHKLNRQAGINNTAI
ncbi:MAG: hypothetical protein INQ03_13155 [Candidatus Heimdallarchaeota archaeon]|nr:hypothetical protein [Candidatus Heimdallarchaeota archaeon]